MKHNSIYIFLLACLCFSLPSVQAQRDSRDSLIRRTAEPNYQTSTESRVAGSKFSYFLKADRETVEGQLDYANDLRDAGNLKKARKAYRAAVKLWPETREAALAQYEFAKLEEHFRSPSRAAEAYEYLFTYYTGSFPHEEALQRLFNLGTDLLEHRKARFLIFPGFKAPERSIPLFENVIQFGPRWHRAGEAQFLIGRALQDTMSYDRAIAAYELVHIRYRDSGWAEEAGFFKVECLNILADESPNSEQALEEAWISTVIFQQRYPDSERNTEIANFRTNLLSRRSEIAFEQARYYDAIAKRPDAALRAYEAFVKKFPSSEWTKPAKLRIEALRNNTL